MKSLRNFKHIDASSVDEAVSLLRCYGDRAWVISGGTDLVGAMRFEVLHDYPQVVINLKAIPGLDYITEDNGELRIGAMVRLRDIAVDSAVNSRYKALAEAAHKVASPAVREMGTISGNICQVNRCWYFRAEDNIFDCLRKGGRKCYAAIGDNRYHSIFGAARVGAPPCSSGCPAGNDVPSYLASIRDGNLAQAARTLLESNPIPAITGRVCPRTCERDCNRIGFGEAVSIRSIERFAGDYILDNADEMYRPPQNEIGRNIAILGSGPAGLSAAYYLRKLGYGVTVFEALEEAGGVLTYGIPPYRLPKDVVRRLVKALESMGIQFRFKVEIGKDLPLEELRRGYAAVFCATGAWQQPSLGMADEELLTPGLEFLARVNRGLRSTSRHKVLVIGGGSVAVDVATTALRLGAGQVTIACLESREEMPALPEEVQQALKEGISIMPSWGPSRVLKTGGSLSGMELVRCVSVFDSEGRFAPVYDSSVKQAVEADQVILAIGQKPALAYAQPLLKVNRGLIAVDPDSQATSAAGVFAGGDAALSGSLSVAAAVASGRRAAAAINLYLGGPAMAEVDKVLDHLTGCSEECLENTVRTKIPELVLSQLGMDTEDIRELDSDEVENEANRCLNCGCVAVNPSDVAAALVALDASIVTSKRTLKAEDFWTANKAVKSTVLENDEIVTEVRIPAPAAGVKTAFVKFALRKSIDFPIVNCAAAIGPETARICLNAVYNKPYRATEAEDAIKGKLIDEASAEAAGAAALAGAVALPYNRYKVQIARAMVKKAILACK
jgi:NADPH-dependent glutamate synthase beta subunit-like oxidoreductase